jgi:hypothetical protein
MIAILDQGLVFTMAVAVEIVVLAMANAHRRR